MKQEDFLRNISRQLGRQAVSPTAPQRTVVGAPEFWTSEQADAGERLTLFCQSLEALAGEVQVCDTLPELQKALETLLQRLAPKRVSSWAFSELAQAGLAEEQWKTVLSPYTLLEWGRCTVDEMANADVGITGCAYAVADTGTLVMTAGQGRGRSVSLLPTVHVAVLRESQIRYRLGEVMAELSRLEELPSSVHFISGPSRSSDIGNDQSIGVHGPAAVYVLIYRDR